jgi:hypothetical protein
MLIYHPAFDAYHCTFRMLVISDLIPKMEADKLRILDFYLTFPGALALATLPQVLGLRKAAKAARNPYREPVNPRNAFKEIREIQETSMRCLAAAGLIDKDELNSGMVVRTGEPVVPSLRELIDSFVLRESDAYNVILKQLADIPLSGPDGLKGRSGLMEYRYDTV